MEAVQLRKNIIPCNSQEVKILICLLSLLIIPCFTESRDVKVSVLNKQGKPVRSVKLEVFPSKKRATTDKTGICLLTGIAAGDSLLIVFPGSSVAGVYPLSGLDELQFNTGESELTALNPATGSPVRGLARKIIQKGELDVESEIKNGATNLEGLLKRMPELMVTGGNISLRNAIQTNTITTTSPVLVVDGMVVRGGLAEANRIVAIQTIESIKIERDGTLWGKDAVNGAILIKLKK